MAGKLDVTPPAILQRSRNHKSKSMCTTETKKYRASAANYRASAAPRRMQVEGKTA
jgi:ribosomal protein S20